MSTNENKKEMFKTAFKGFDKKGVIEYISKLSAIYNETVASKNKEIENYKTKAKEAEQKLSKSSADLAACAAENIHLKQELDTASSEASSLKTENAELKEKLESLGNNPLSDSEKARLEDEVESLRKELSELKLQTEKNKLEIADVLIKAEQMSKRLCDEAIASANEKKAEIEKQIVSKKSELLGLSGEIERMKNVFSDLYKRYVKE